VHRFSVSILTTTSAAPFLGAYITKPDVGGDANDERQVDGLLIDSDLTVASSIGPFKLL